MVHILGNFGLNVSPGSGAEIVKNDNAKWCNILPPQTGSNFGTIVLYISVLWIWGLGPSKMCLQTIFHFKVFSLFARFKISGKLNNKKRDFLKEIFSWFRIQRHWQLLIPFLEWILPESRKYWLKTLKNERFARGLARCAEPPE